MLSLAFCTTAFAGVDDVTGEVNPKRDLIGGFTSPIAATGMPLMGFAELSATERGRI